MEDSPGQPLSDLEKQMTVQDSIKTWLMIKPKQANSIWIPIKIIDWSWQADVSRRKSQQWSYNSRTNPAPSVSTPNTFPVWNQNIKQIIDAGFINE